MHENLNHPYPMQIFIFGNNTELGEEIAKLLKVTPAKHTTRFFPDGECIPHQTETVRGRDVYIILTSQNGPDTDKWLFNYLRFVHSVKEGHPHMITVVMPKSAHQRQDVENRESRQPTMSDFFPKLLQAAGADRIVVARLHNPASRTKNPPMENIDTTVLIIERIKSEFSDLSCVAIASGDMGGSKYARKIAEELGVPLLITDKDRDPKTGKTRAINVYTHGEVSENITTVVFVDDLISTFGTLRQAGDAVFEKFGHIVNYYAAATHPDFGEETLENIVQSIFCCVWVVNTVPVSDAFVEGVIQTKKRLEFISSAKLFAQTLDNLHNSGSVSSLWIKNGNQKGELVSEEDKHNS